MPGFHNLCALPAIRQGDRSLRRFHPLFLPVCCVTHNKSTIRACFNPISPRPNELLLYYRLRHRDLGYSVAQKRDKNPRNKQGVMCFFLVMWRTGLVNSAIPILRAPTEPPVTDPVLRML